VRRKLGSLLIESGESHDDRRVLSWCRDDGGGCWSFLEGSRGHRRKSVVALGGITGKTEEHLARGGNRS